MTKQKKIVNYATGNVTIGIITQLVDGGFVDYFVGKVRGTIVSRWDNEYKFSTKEDARNCAFAFRAKCRLEAKEVDHPARGDRNKPTT